MVRMLADEGMSTRAIAPIVGVHHDTVAADIKASSVGSPTVEPRAVVGNDGRTRTYTPAPIEDAEEEGPCRKTWLGPSTAVAALTGAFRLRSSTPARVDCIKRPKGLAACNTTYAACYTLTN